MRLERFVLAGAHVRLEPLGLEHVSDLVAAANEDRSTYGFTSVPKDLPSATEYVTALLRDAELDSAVPFAQRQLSDGAVVGCTRFMNIVWWTSSETPVEVEVGGTWLAARAQRTPVNTEAKLLLLTHAFETWHVNRVAICTAADNERSRRAIERLGATFEGVLRNHRALIGDDVQVAGQPRDSALYSIIDREWPTVREMLQARLGRTGPATA
jgi:RimJ/RimL family protein N-acetyltransferase